MMLNVGLADMKGWNGIREKAEKENSARPYITNDEISR
jgi:hypothetical protein